MKNNDPTKFTEEDIVRLAQTINKPLPEGFEKELMAKVDEIELKKQAEPQSSPKLDPDPDCDVEDDIEP